MLAARHCLFSRFYTTIRTLSSTLYKLVQSGALPGQKVGKQWRFRKSAVDEWLAQNPRHHGNGKGERGRER